MAFTTTSHSLRLLILLLLLPTAVQQMALRPSAFLVDSNGTSWEQFGFSVAIDNGILVVGVQRSDKAGFDAGAAFIYALVDGEWTEEAMITASDAETNDYFGNSVAVSNGVVAVAAKFDDNERGTSVGAVYVYVHEEDGSWTEQAKLVARDGTTFDYFGHAISMHGTTLVAGVVSDDDLGVNSGSVFVFTFDDGSWTEEAKLVASDGSAQDWFGRAVAIRGDRLIVGSSRDDDYSGSAYLFQQMADGTWTEQAKLTASDVEVEDYFGLAVDVFGDTVVVGSPRHDGRGTLSGAAYVFKFDSGTWTEQAKLFASDTVAWHQFGWSLALTDGRLIVSSPWNSPGEVYLFSSEVGSWTEQARFAANGTATGHLFGYAVAVDQDTVVIGHPYYEDLKGAAYIYEELPFRPERSDSPSTMPTQLPTILPTSLPTTNLPSTVPSVTVSVQPSATPTKSLTTSPSSMTPSQSIAPSAFPSFEPCRRWLSRCVAPEDCCTGVCRLGRCRLWETPDLDRPSAVPSPLPKDDVSVAPSNPQTNSPSRATSNSPSLGKGGSKKPERRRF